MLSEKQKLKKIIDIGLEISQFKDVDSLLEKILTIARQLVNAEAGSIFIREGNLLKFSYTQNEKLQQKLPPGKKLIYSTFVVPIDCESIVGYVSFKGERLNVPDVYKLSSNAPYSFDSSYDEVSRYRTQSVLAFPLKTSKGIIGVLQLINARTKTNRIKPFSAADEPLIEHFANNAAIAIERAQLTRDIILRVIKMAELRDPKETGAHVNRVASYAVETYEHWATLQGISHEEIEKNRDLLRLGAMLHDVGKVAISDTILKKPARLDPEQYEIMKQHTYLGARLFADRYSDFDEVAAIVALNHHERWDGKGYPGHINPMSGKAIPGYENRNGKARGKRDEEIPPFGRIVAIADVYDALCSKRVYKDAWDEATVLEELQRESGKHFDPEMVKSFLSILDVIHNVAKRYPD
jgi:HD-GYP domain-containing protein (c-di-GMP phosphodiesterase class II)